MSGKLTLILLVSSLGFVTAAVIKSTSFNNVMHMWLEDCGKSKYPDAGQSSSEKFIVGGQDTRLYEFPWQVAMLRLRSSGAFTLTCGGSVLNSEWILTAAHCVDETSDPSTLKIVAGAWNISDYQNDPSAQVFNVVEIIFHSAYDTATAENDIAVLRLDSTIQFNENVTSACPALENYDYTGQMCVISGWGALNSYIGPAPQVFPDLLQWASLPITNQEDCAARYASIGSTITPDMICAGAVNETEYDSCQGDSGGPLVCQNATTSRFEQVGIVSFGFGCANRYPGVYARVSYFLDWIANATTATV